ncbi:PilZ domain-containing protein [Clostridium hydrogenum]|uniref:PilZ domain-containing protein n=1 Tax=Clostridium hydrogenum TaxID=2855764 RepID=UPI001F1D64BE|nr:PilZ domain-containing protein [Clostridium hydrogenum]
MPTNENNEYVNKRNFFRVYLRTPLCAEISIISVNGKSVKTKPSNICILDIGIGGVKFRSKLKLPIGNNVLYEFKMKFLHTNYSFDGTIVRNIENDTGEIFYGAAFIIMEDYTSNYFKALNDLALVIKRNISDHGCEFCEPQKCPIKSNKN